MSDFKNLQQDVCLQPEKEAEPDKICPTCIPNESYMAPNWWESLEPFLNEKTCEYWITVMVNTEGDIYTPSTVQNSPYSFKTLLRTYIRSGVRKAIRFYGKLETDEIVCASPPQEGGGTCRPIYEFDYEQFVEQREYLAGALGGSQAFDVLSINDEITSRYPQITNTNALELYARAKDYHFYGFTDQPMAVLVTIPAYIFDQVPNAPDLGFMGTNVETLVIQRQKFLKDITKFKAAMRVFADYQSFFKEMENGNLYEKESEGRTPFYIKFYSGNNGRVDKFVGRLTALLNANGFSFEMADKSNSAEEVEITFNKDDPANPFTIENIRARRKGCPYKKCSVGLDSFVKVTSKDQTMLGYLARINEIGRVVSARETPPWLDFIVKYTYPELAVNYGSNDAFEDVNQCQKAQWKKIDDFILKSSMSFVQAFAYQMNKQVCKTLTEKEEFEPKKYDAVGNLTTNFKKSVEEPFKIIDDAIGADARHGLSLEFSKTVNTLTEIKPDNILKDLMSQLNPCNWKQITVGAIKCLMSGMTVEEGYRVLIKKTLGSIGAEGLKIIIDALPANKQQEIMAKVRETFNDMPAPWESGFEAGSLEVARTNRASEEVESKSSAASTALDESLSID